MGERATDEASVRQSETVRRFDLELQHRLQSTDTQQSQHRLQSSRKGEYQPRCTVGRWRNVQNRERVLAAAGGVGGTADWFRCHSARPRVWAIDEPAARQTATPTMALYTRRYPQMERPNHAM